jgi:hypothetical protein
MNQYTELLESMKDGKALWVDDLRPIRKGFDIWAKTYQEAIKAIDKYNIVKISFDHDLGEDSKMVAYGEEREGTGNDVAKYIEMLAKTGKQGRIEYNVHSANPVGEKNILATMKSAERYW